MQNAREVHEPLSCTAHSAIFISHSAFEWGPWSDSHRRIRVYETRPVAAEAQGLKMASTTGIAPVTSGFARRRSDLTELRGQLASVIGLAPIRPGLKDRLLELLCIHGQNFGWKAKHGVVCSQADINSVNRCSLAMPKLGLLSRINVEACVSCK